MENYKEKGFINDACKEHEEKTHKIALWPQTDHGLTIRLITD